MCSFHIWALPVGVGVGGGGVKRLAGMAWSTFFAHPNGQFLVWGGSEHLPGRFVHFLAHFGNVKNRWNKARKKCSMVPLWTIFARETTHFKKGGKSYFCKTNLYSNISVFSSNGHPYFCPIFVASILPRLPSWDLSWTENIKRRRQGNISTSFLRRGGKIFPRVCFLFIFNVSFSLIQLNHLIIAKHSLLTFIALNQVLK